MIWFNSEAILLGLKQDPEVARLAATYLKWAVLGLPAYTFNAISRRYFQSQGNALSFIGTRYANSVIRAVHRPDTGHHVRSTDQCALELAFGCVIFVNFLTSISSTYSLGP